MSGDKTFLDSLSPSDKARYEAFDALRILHPQLARVRDQVWTAVQPTHPAQVIAVCGPTGVGKSMLLSQTAKDLRAMYGADSWCDPVLEVVCPGVGGGSYDFKRTHWDVHLTAIGDQFVDCHFDPDVAAARRRSGSEGHTSRRRSSGWDLRLATQNYLTHRGCLAVLLDEAQHMATVTTKRRACQYMDVIKSFGQACGVKQVLFGTEEMLPLLRGNAQLTRRTEEVFFDAYVYTEASDVDAFSQVFRQMATKLPCDRPSVFEAHLAEVFVRSAGCVGVLKEWLARALVRALQRGSTKVAYSDLLATKDSKARLESFLEGIETFREFTREDSCMDAIYKAMGVSVENVPEPPRESREARAVGEREPHRDPVPRPSSPPVPPPVSLPLASE